MRKERRDEEKEEGRESEDSRRKRRTGEVRGEKEKPARRKSGRPEEAWVVLPLVQEVPAPCSVKVLTKEGELGKNS